MKKILLMVLALFVLSSVYCYAAGVKAPRSKPVEIEVPEKPEKQGDGIIVHMKDESIQESNLLNDLIEPYVDEYGLPDKAIENIISRAGILYQAVTLEWKKYDVIIEFHRKLIGKSLDESLEPYMEKYGLPNRTAENIISQSGVVYQEITLEWTEYEIYIKIHRKLTGDWKLRETEEADAKINVEQEKSIIEIDQEDLIINND